MELKLTLREAASVCGINLKTAFLWRHRFLMAQAGQNNDKLAGIIEVDEFFLAYSEKGSKKITAPKQARKRGGDIDKRTKEKLKKFAKKAKEEAKGFKEDLDDMEKMLGKKAAAKIKKGGAKGKQAHLRIKKKAAATKKKVVKHINKGITSILNELLKD